MSTLISNASVRCVYKMPSANQKGELQRWLEENEAHYVVILEKGNCNSDHPRMLFANIEDEESLKKIAWELVFLEFHYDKTTTHSYHDKEDMEKAFAKMSFFQEGVYLVASDFQDRGLDKLANFLKNEPHLKRARRAQDLFGMFTNIPAIICGAGSSLETAGSSLSALKENALIFAGGTALSALSKMKILPHFGGMIDPHPPSSRYEILHESLTFPMFFQSRVHPDLLDKVKGPLFWVGGSENDFFDEETFDGGWNVSTFLTAVAVLCGCNPIILVGVDLAQSENKPYAMDLDRPEGGELIQMEGGLFTRKDWLFAADWLSSFAAKHNEITWIQDTQGIQLKGFTQKKLRELDLHKKVTVPRLPSEKRASEKKGVKVVPSEKLISSLDRISMLILSVLQLLESLFPAPYEENEKYLSLQLEFEKELAYIRFLRPIWNVWKYVFEREISKEIPTMYGIELNKWLFMKGICDDARKI